MVVLKADLWVAQLIVQMESRWAVQLEQMLAAKMDWKSVVGRDDWWAAEWVDQKVGHLAVVMDDCSVVPMASWTVEQTAAQLVGHLVALLAGHLVLERVVSLVDWKAE